MAKKKKTKNKLLKCPHCGNTDGEWRVRGKATIHWHVGSSEEGIDSDGTISPEDGIDWDEVSFGKDYELVCPACDEHFAVPEGFQLQPGWG